MDDKKEQTFRKMVFSGYPSDDAELIPIIADGDESEFDDFEAPEILPILPLRNTVLFPGVVIPITVGRQKSLKLIHDVSHADRFLGTVTQVDGAVDDPEKKDLYQIGTVAQILKILEMPDGSTSVIIQGKRRFEIREYVEDFPYYKAKVTLLDEVLSGKHTTRFQAMVGSLKDLSVKIAQYTPNVPPEATFAVRNIENSTFLINFICSNTDLKVEEKQNLLGIADIRERGIQAMSYLVREVQMLELKRDIQAKVKLELDQQQREFLLNQQIKTIQNELGGNPAEQEIADLRKAGKNKKWSEEIAACFEKEISKLSRLNPAAGEYSVQYSYCQTLLDLPWN
ncbi:MAG: LON peptidase substrate-binding domain-containing protein, partial [Mangrovibacterium sp.]|nr:LON peptidase substrate-binding domain-containing protein [Mangrovibacterium sp.]